LKVGEDLHDLIYLEHIEECAMLFERRQLCLEDPESTLEDVAEHDARMEAHIDALVLGGARARRACLESVTDEDPSTLHVVSRVLLRCLEPAALVSAAAQLELEDEDREARTAALGAALRFELSPAWVPGLAELLDQAALAQLVARAIGARRLAAGAPLLRERLARSGAQAELSVVWALGELRDPASLAHFHQLLGQVAEPQLWSALALACLKLGDRRIEATLRSGAGLSSWSPLAQVLCFEVPTEWLLGALARARNEELLVALALKGDPAAFSTLTSLLPDPALGQLAAGALFTITGAPLLAPAPEPGPIDPRAEPSEGPDALASGWLRLSQSPEDWRAWIQADLPRWSVGHRYRLGHALALESTTRSALCCAVPLAIREALFDELALVHGRDPCSRPTSLPREQIAQLGQTAAASLFGREAPSAC
jgi:hypothetical protein